MDEKIKPPKQGIVFIKEMNESLPEKGFLDNIKGLFSSNKSLAMNLETPELALSKSLAQESTSITKSNLNDSEKTNALLASLNDTAIETRRILRDIKNSNIQIAQNV